jgi:hypothetical protein
MLKYSWVGQLCRQRPVVQIDSADCSGRNHLSLLGFPVRSILQRRQGQQEATALVGVNPPATGFRAVVVHGGSGGRYQLRQL